MFRCALPVIACAALAACLPAAAQVSRSFPADALRGELVVTQPPEALLNGKPARLAPGARLRGTDNLLLMSGAVVGRKLPVHYTLDPLGLVLEVWVLREDELAVKPWPRTPDEARRWTFDPVAQTWSRP